MKCYTRAAVLKLFLKVISVLAVFLLVACNQYYSDQHIEIKEDGLIYKVGHDDPFTGRIIDTLNSNILEYDVVNGLKNGDFRVSSMEGIISMYGKVEDNRNIGEWNYYYSNGNLESRGNFKYDLPYGKWEFYYSNGNLKETGTFVEGYKTGDWYQYTENGELISLITYDMGEKLSEVKFNFSMDV